MLPAELNYPVHEKELLALVKLCTKHRHYLIGKPVVAYTDHRSITHLQTQPNLSNRQIRWVQQLQDFDIKIEYLPGQFNHLADYLSRNPAYKIRCHDCKKIFDQIPECANLTSLAIQDSS